MDILNSNKYCIMCSIALMHVKIKILKTLLKLLYIIAYLLFNNNKCTLTCGKSKLCKHNQSLDMDILKSNKYCILCSIALMHVKIKIYKTPFTLLIICCLTTLNEILTCGKSQLCTHNQS